MEPITFKVGDLSKRTGLSIRTLHYYDEIKLLSPSHRTESGYRVYGKEDIIRLQQIIALKQIGLSLEDVRSCLDNSDRTFIEVLQLHIAKVRKQIDLSQQLLERLENVEQTVANLDVIPIEEILQIIQVMDMLENYYSPEQLEILKQRQELLGEERMQQAKVDWETLIAQVQAEMEKGTDPASEVVQVLVRRRQALIQEFTGGDPELESALKQMYEQGEDSVSDWGENDASLAAYMSRALQC
ncbi:MerR family transcriptional regulator [Pseudanabaena minima]|uniref:MerR family transcriptional regulator n=1 Tax=Pseudanabaena minima TaxID=890415 RepID=UPI003DA8DDC2